MFILGLVSTVASQQEGGCLHVLPVYAGVLSGYSSFLPRPKSMHVRLNGDAKLSLGVSLNAQTLGCTSKRISSAVPKPR